MERHLSRFQEPGLFVTHVLLCQHVVRGATEHSISIYHSYNHLLAGRRASERRGLLSHLARRCHDSQHGRRLRLIPRHHHAQHRRHGRPNRAHLSSIAHLLRFPHQHKVKSSSNFSIFVET